MLTTAAALATAAVASAAAPAVSVFPSPGTRYALPATQITFRGIPAGQLGSVHVVGTAASSSPWPTPRRRSCRFRSRKCQQGGAASSASTRARTCSRPRSTCSRPVLTGSGARHADRVPAQRDRAAQRHADAVRGRRRAAAERGRIARGPDLAELQEPHVFVGWGQQPYFSEFNTRGQVNFEARFTTATNTYRAYRFHWHAQPPTTPAIAISRRSHGITTAYGSWNGANDVAAWRVLAGPSPGALKPLRIVKKRGFETALEVHSTARYFQVQALGNKAKVLANSKVTS